MRHHDEEPHALQLHVRIDVDERISAQLNAAVGCPLDGKLVDHRAEVGRIVFREISHVGTQLDAQHLSYLELQIEVGEEVPGGQGQHFLVAIP